MPVKNNWLRKIGINTVIDIGASTGNYARKIREILPEAFIHSFEPIEESFVRLKKTMEDDEKSTQYNIALSDTTGSAELNISRNIGSSSFLPMTNTHTAAFPDTEVIKSISVHCDTLDNILKKEMLPRKILMKLDVQGSELKVLEGSQEILSETEIVYTEVSFCELYEKQPLVNTVIHYLWQKGFIVCGFDDTSQSLSDGSFLQSNIYFRRKREINNGASPE